MKLKAIKFGGILPTRAYSNDAGLDCYAKESIRLYNGQSVKMPLGFGIELPDGYVGLLLPRSSMNAKGLIERVGVIDSGYRGEISAIICNMSGDTIDINAKDKVAQLVIVPCAICEVVLDKTDERGINGFGSSGK